MSTSFIIFVGIMVLSWIILEFFYFNKKDPKPKHHYKGTVFYHEDDYCQIEIVPKENLSSLMIHVENIRDFSTKNGYSEVYIREENLVPLKSKKITKSELDNLLAKLETNRHTKIATGYGSNYRIKSRNTIGFGKDYSMVYFNFKYGVVENIWITNLSGLNNEKVVHVLSEIGAKWDLIMMDWNRSELIDLSNKKMIENYLD